MIMDYTQEDQAHALLADREAAAKALAWAAEAVPAPRGFRATFAARLARLAFQMDRETARFWLTWEASKPVSNGSAS